MKDIIDNYLSALTDTINNINVDEIEKCAEVLLKAYDSDNNIFICGNGGSSLTASHFACDINKGVSFGRSKRFKVIPLSSCVSTISTYANDISHDVSFVEQLKNFFTEGDVVIGISGSGNSINVINALEYANKNGGVTVGFTGYSGGVLKDVAQYSINASVDDMQISEDMHMVFVHLMMKIFSQVLSD